MRIDHSFNHSRHSIIKEIRNLLQMHCHFLKTGNWNGEPPIPHQRGRRPCIHLPMTLLRRWGDLVVPFFSRFHLVLLLPRPYKFQPLLLLNRLQMRRCPKQLLLSVHHFSHTLLQWKVYFSRLLLRRVQFGHCCNRRPTMMRNLHYLIQNLLFAWHRLAEWGNRF